MPKLLHTGALALTFCAAAFGQLTAAADGPVAMGHHHLNVSDRAAHERFWIDLMGGESAMLGRLKIIQFPNALLVFKEQAPTGGTRGTSVNHIGFQVPDVDGLVEKLKAAGIEIATQQEVSGGRAESDVFHSPSQDVDLAFVIGPDDIKIELMENEALDRPIVNHHIHFAGPVAEMQKWYLDMFGGKTRRRGIFESTDLAGVNLTFAEAERVSGTKGTVLDHIGFEIDDLESFCKKLEAKGVTFDVPFREVPALGLKIAFFTDPWGTYIELTEGLDAL